MAATMHIRRTTEFISEVYLDDIICYSRASEGHLTRLGAIIDRLAKANLKLKASKCYLFQAEVHFLVSDTDEEPLLVPVTILTSTSGLPTATAVPILGSA